MKSGRKFRTMRILAEHSGEGKPETFTFLGFTHYCGKRWSNGPSNVWRKTAKKRMVVKRHALKAELRLRTHEPVIAVWLDVPSALWIQSLCPKLPG
jgi:hypothetical protein